MVIFNKLVENSKFSLCVPWYLVYRKVVNRGIPTDVPVEEIWKELKESNPRLVFDRENITRLKTRRFINGEASYIDTSSVRLNLRAPTIPDYVIMWSTRLELKYYIPTIRQCFNCGQLNHAIKFCKNVAKCLICGLDAHSTDKCSNIAKCINCNGNHRFLAKDCSEVTKRKVTEIMITQDIDFNTAKRIILQGTPSLPSRSSTVLRTAPPKSQDFLSLHDSFNRTVLDSSARSTQASLAGWPLTRSFADVTNQDAVIKDKNKYSQLTSPQLDFSNFDKIISFLSSEAFTKMLTKIEKVKK